MNTLYLDNEKFSIEIKKSIENSKLTNEAVLSRCNKYRKN